MHNLIEFLWTFDKICSRIGFSDHLFLHRLHYPWLRPLRLRNLIILNYHRFSNNMTWHLRWLEWLECLVPFDHVNEPIFSYVNCLKKILKNLKMRHWLISHLVNLYNKSIKIFISHLARSVTIEKSECIFRRKHIVVYVVIKLYQSHLRSFNDSAHIIINWKFLNKFQPINIPVSAFIAIV